MESEDLAGGGGGAICRDEGATGDAQEEHEACGQEDAADHDAIFRRVLKSVEETGRAYST